MPITYNAFNSIFTTTGNAHAATASDDIAVASGGYLISTVHDAISLGGTANTYNIEVTGNVASHASGYAGIYASAGNTVFVQVKLGGSVYGETNGLYIWSPASVVNSGSILSNSASSAAIQFEASSGDESVTNLGLISSTLGNGIRFSGSGVHTLTNAGLISVSGGRYAVTSAGSGADRVTNTGTITGDIDLGAGSDTFNTTTGRVNGGVWLGSGSDTFHGSSIVDTVYGGAHTDRLNGNAGADFLYGDGGTDTLDGGTGADRLAGGADNDTYVVDNRLDIIDEFTGNGTLDVLRAKVSYTLGAGDDIEQLQTFSPSGSAAINLTGNGFNQGIAGNAGANRLNGAGGDDVLAGGRGNDILTGGANGDSFLFNTALNARSNLDRITDFSAAQDSIILENSLPGTFQALANGFLAVGAFKANATGIATDGTDRIVYNTQTGALSYDADGNGVGGAVQFAILNGRPVISHADFFVI